MTQVHPVIKIDKGIKPKPRKTKYNFDDMNEGDSFYYEGARSLAIIQFAYRLARGKYKTEPEGNGWRFYLLKDMKHLFLEKVEAKPSKYKFDEMDVGDSIYYEGSRNTAIIAFAYRLASGRFKVECEGNGYKFYLTKSVKQILDF